MLPSNVAGVRPAAGQKQYLAIVPRVVAAAVKEKHACAFISGFSARFKL